MRYDGYNFRKSRTVVTLPNHDANKNLMPYVQEGHDFYMHFGRIVKQGKPVPHNAVQTTWKWDDTGESVYAVPFKDQRHSLTNMVYVGEHIYLFRGGVVFSAKR